MQRSTVVTPVVRWLTERRTDRYQHRDPRTGRRQHRIGFAIPSNMVKNLTSQMVETAR